MGAECKVCKPPTKFIVKELNNLFFYQWYRDISTLALKPRRRNNESYHRAICIYFSPSCQDTLSFCCTNIIFNL